MNKQIDPAYSPTIRFGIRGRLFIGFTLLVIPILIIVLLLLYKINIVENYTTSLVNVGLPTQNYSATLDAEIYETQLNLYTWLLTGDQNAKNDIERGWKDIAQTQNYMNNSSKHWENNIYLQNWITLNSQFDILRQIQNKLFTTTDRAAIVDIIKNEAIPQVNKMLDIIDGKISSNNTREGGMFDILIAELNQGAQSILGNINFLKIVSITLFLSIIVLAISISILTARRILTPLNNAIDIAKKIAAGERNISIEITSNDETGALLSALSMMQDAIKLNESKLQESEANSRALFENIFKTANEFSSHSSKVAAGDLKERLALPAEKSMQQLGRDLNTMTDSLANVTKQITQACHNMVTTLEEVKQAANIQTSGATEQASSINQITASLEEIEKSTNQTLEKAKTLGKAAERTSEKGQKGLEAVEQSIQGMKEVREKVQIIAQTILDLSNQTQQVGEITAVVNTLAQQSKMLALNASIEAAKAGEAGKGFAVVAVEVKNLAEQSEQATTQVQKILEDIKHAAEKAVMVTEEGTKGVDHGTSLVEQTGDIIRSLSEVIRETTSASQQIEAAVRQESIGIEQITAGMGEINQVTSSFVVSVKQTTEAIDNLSQISRNLKEKVDTYKV